MGNPGQKYEGTRHNVGFKVIERIVERDPERWSQLKKTKLDATGGMSTTALRVLLKNPGASGGVSLFKLLLFMNEAGRGVSAIQALCGARSEDLLIICDDVSLRLGQMRLRRSGSSGGHQGLESIIEHIGGDNFARLRVGIGHPGPGADLARFVLESFLPGEEKLVRTVMDRAAEASLVWYEKGIDEAMNLFNRRSLS